MADQENTGTIITPTNPAAGATPAPGISIPVLDQSEPAENITSPNAPANPAPTEPLVPPAADPLPIEPLPTPPAQASIPPGSTPPAGPFQPTIPPPEVPIATLPVVPIEPAPPASAAGPTAPEFGQLQPKVDAHPLFSGAKTPPPKRPRKKSRILWPLGVLIALLILGYLAVDAGLVGGASHLPFHVFKQDTVATAPSIPAAPAPTTKTPTATDPYAGWKTYSSTAGQFSLKYPSTWVVPDNTSSCTDGLLLLAPDTQSLGKCGTESSGEVSFLSVAGNQSASYQIKATDGYANVTTESVTVQGVAGTKYTGTAQGQQDKPGVGGLPDNTKVIVYVFYTGGKTYVSTYNQTPSYPDASSDFDKIVTGTLKFSS